ncbi:MAG: cytoplasmic protein [SAR324 cluster bacterium]|uniref:Cytoplasmic protein n=1 Tax=SAR324 cluster bacterium TaxID=2024889 RepID=A0A432GKB5_9DELT|nr:MAG: cytoplasmic protein [SAR324 cluster bacterium]
MRHILIIISLLLFTSPLFGDSHKGKILYGWETSSGIQLREFGDKDIHPQYKGDVENRKPNGLGIMNFPDGRKYVGEWKNGKRTFAFPSGFKYVGEYKVGKMWNVKKYNKDGKYVGEYKNGEVWNGIVYDKNGNIKGTWVNGVKQ